MSYSTNIKKEVLTLSSPRCIGKNLAHVELYKAVCDLVRKYDFKVTNPDNMWREEQKLFLYKTNFMVTISKRKNE